MDDTDDARKVDQQQTLYADDRLPDSRTGGTVVRTSRLRRFSTTRKHDGEQGGNYAALLRHGCRWKVAVIVAMSAAGPAAVVAL